MQFNFLKINSPPLVGVDISSTAIKLVELGEMGRERCSLERYAIEPLPKDAIVEGNIAKMDEVVEAMKRAWERMGSRSRHVALALPAAAVITKKIILPADLTEEEMEIQVEAEANQVIPFALDEVNLDFQVLNPVPNSVNDVEVLIVASRKEKVEDRVAVAEAAGLKVLVVDTEFNASQTAYEGMAHILPESGRGQIVALIDIGATTMHILVFVNNIMVYSREQSFGGNQLTLEIQRRYGLSSDEAEKAKRKGNLLDNYDLEVLHPFIETLALEISRALQLFFSSTSYIKVDHIVLAGGCTVLPGLDEAVANRTEASTLVANPFVGMTLSARVMAAKLAVDAPALMVACGLAMRRFDTV
ncbi:MAG: pilus assembly protein PilM [Burkholderiales bacterium]